jgi:hypothetical protein
MIRSRRELSPEVRALLDEERAIPAQPAAVRARAMARARAALAAGLATPVASPARTALRSRWAAAAVLVCMASAAAVLAAYGIHAHIARLAAPVVLPPIPAPARSGAVRKAPEAPPVVAPADDEAPPAPPRTLSPPRLSRAEALRAELRLLRHARAAVAREDFAAALVPIAEHVRRFKDGRLAEEREALRVKALVGLGRAQDTRRAAAAFRTRFPHSVLLPAVDRMSASGP